MYLVTFFWDKFSSYCRYNSAVTKLFSLRHDRPAFVSIGVLICILIQVYFYPVFVKAGRAYHPAQELEGFSAVGCLDAEKSVGSKYILFSCRDKQQAFMVARYNVIRSGRKLI